MTRPGRRNSVIMVVLALALAGVGAFTAFAANLAVDANGQLEDPGLQKRFERITQELRCLVCQNESIADSKPIWAAPFVMLLLGGVIIYRVVRHRARLPLDEPASGS